METAVTERIRIEPGAGGEVARPRRRTTLAILDWTSGGLKTSIMLLAGFVATPYLLAYLGAERLGALRAAQQWNGYLSHLYFGLRSAFGVLLLEAVTRGDRDRICGLEKTGLKLLFRQSLPIFLLNLAMAWGMPVLIPVGAPLRNELRVGALIGAAAVLISSFDLFRTTLECLQLGYLVNLALMLQSVAATALAVLLAGLGYGLPGQFAAAVFGTFIAYALFSGFSVARLPGVLKVKALPLERRKLWKMRWPLAAAQAAGGVNLVSDYVVIGMMISPAAVTAFSITQRLLMALGGLLNTVGSAAWAGLSQLYVVDRTAFRQRVLELARLSLGCGAVMIGTAAFYNAHFVHLWVGQEYYGGAFLTILTAAQVIILGYAHVFGPFITMQGDIRHTVGVFAAGAIANLILSLSLAPRLGMFGVTLATVLVLFPITWNDIRVFRRRYGISGRGIAAESLRALLLAIPWLALVHYLRRGRPYIAGWRWFSLEFAAALCAGAAYCWFVVFRPEDRRNWMVRLRRLATSE